MLSSSHLQANQTYKRADEQRRTPRWLACPHILQIQKETRQGRVIQKGGEAKKSWGRDFDKCATFTHSDRRLGENDVGGRAGMNKLHLTR